MKITCPFFSQEAWDKAVETVQVCHQQTPVRGLIKPYYAPGGKYGADWWSLDYTLIIDAVKWFNFAEAEEYIQNLAAVQRPDGRIPLYGAEYFGHVPNVQEPISSLPKRMRTLPILAAMTRDEQQKQTAMQLLKKDIDWWFAARRDEKTGLITAVFEETFLPNTDTVSMEYASIDTNTEVMLGSRSLAVLFAGDGQTDLALQYTEKADGIAQAIRQYLRNEPAGCFLPYDTKYGTSVDKILASTFLGFTVAQQPQKDQLAALLTDPDAFNWGTRPLTSASKKDPIFFVHTGDYTGNPSWSGSVWTLLNQQTVVALRSAGLDELADRLTLETVKAFRMCYTEFLQPFTGSGEGVQDYGWTAAQILQLMIEDVFGAAYSAREGLTVRPHIPAEYLSQVFELQGLSLPDGSVANIRIENGKPQVSVVTGA